MLIHGKLTEAILGAATEVHQALGPGLLEVVYETCLCHELSTRGITYEHQVLLPVMYKGVQLDCGFRMELVVEDLVVVELKSVETVLPIHEAQLITYLRLSGKIVGLLLNFNVIRFKEGITRRVV